MKVMKFVKKNCQLILYIG